MELLRALENCGEFRYIDLGVKQGEDKAMILAEQWKKEGFEQDIEKGKEQVRAIAKNMLAGNISLDLIAKLTSISIKELKTLQH